MRSSGSRALMPSLTLLPQAQQCQRRPGLFRKPASPREGRVARSRSAGGKRWSLSRGGEPASHTWHRGARRCCVILGG